MGQIFLLVFLTYLLLVALKMRKFAPWLPTRNRDIERIVRIMNIQKNDVCYELGSGDGRVSVYLAKESEASVIGIEVFPLLHAIAMLRARF